MIAGQGKVTPSGLKSSQGEEQKSRQGRVLKDKKVTLNRDSEREGKQLKESKKSGTRTISVREWLRRG